MRVPYADFGPRRVLDNLSDEQVLFLTDIFRNKKDNCTKVVLKPGE